MSRSRDVSVAEQQMLLEKIQNRHKMERIREKLRQEVELLQAAQLTMVEEKEREGVELRLNIKESVEESREKIEEMMRNTQNNIKKMEWQSNKRQVEMKDKILVLVGKKKVRSVVSKTHHNFVIGLSSCQSFCPIRICV